MLRWWSIGRWIRATHRRVIWMQKARIAILSTPTHHHPYSIGLLSATFRQVNSTSSMTLATILSILMESHKDSGTTSLTRTLTTKTTNLAIRINRIILQCSHFLPENHQYISFFGRYFLCLCLIFLGVVYCFFFLFLAPPSRLNTNWTVASWEML